MSLTVGTIDTKERGLGITDKKFMMSQEGLMPTKVAVYGAGGFGREVAWLVDVCGRAGAGYEVVCFIDDDPAIAGQVLNDIPCMGIEAAQNRFPDARVVTAIGSPAVRQRLVEKSAAAGFGFETVIHPDVERSKWIEYGEGTVICAGNILTTNIELGKHVQINLDCTIGHDVIMGDYCTTAPGVHISGYCHFGKRVYIGTGAVLINGTAEAPLVIGDDVVIGAGACVVRSVEAGQTVVGVPAKPIRRS